MNNARLFAIGMVLLMVFAFGVLVESTINGSEHKAKLSLTGQVQDLYFENLDLKENLSACNYQLGNTQTIELISPVTRGMLR